MSDPTAEPGAPTSKETIAPAPSAIPPPAEKSIAKEVQKEVPYSSSMMKVASTPDRVLLRLNKLLSSPGGLSSFLSTFNYTLYLLTYLETKTVPLQAKLYQLLGKGILPALTSATAPSKIAALGSLLSSTRTTLRLFGLLPLYAWLRQLLQGPKPGQDPVLYSTALTQCLLYMAFQFLENVGVLTDNKVLSPAVSARFNKSGSTASVFLWSYRAWLGGVLCDFIRLGREAQLEAKKRSERSDSEKGEIFVKEQDTKTDAKWWSEMVVPLSWTPVALHFATGGGVPGFNMGIMGLCGGMAGLGRTAGLWAETSE